MGQSLSQLYIHLTFSTKSRNPLIKPEIKDELHAYIAGTLKEFDSPALIINSVPDHIHILFRLSKNNALAKIVEEVKKGSSKWMKSRIYSHLAKPFSWQIGYGAFSVSSSKVGTVTKYISRQEEHHKTMSYKEEVEKFMREYNILDYNPEYYWR
jgi:REP element-mobilizing transposase RayT